MDDQLIALAISLVGQNLWLPDATSVAILVLSPLIFLERTPGFPLPSKRGLPFLFLLSKFNKKSLLGSQSSRARLLMQLAKVNCRQHRLWGSCHHFPGVVIQCLSQYDLIPHKETVFSETFLCFFLFFS